MRQVLDLDHGPLLIDGETVAWCAACEDTCSSLDPCACCGEEWA